MTASSSNPFRIGVVSSSGELSLIQRAVAGVGEFSGQGPMPQNSWRQLTGVQNQDAVLFNDSPVGSTVVAQFNTAPWNPVSRRVEGVGSGHAAPDCRYWQYIDGGADDGKFIFAANVQTQGVAVNHGFDHSALNPHTGDFYHRDGTAGGTYLHFWRKPNASDTFTRIADLWPTGVEYNGIACGTTWANAGFLGSGAQGCYIFFGMGSNGSPPPDGWSISAYDPLAASGAGSWFYSQGGKTPGSPGTETYHGVAEFSGPKSLLLYGGGNADPFNLWRMDAEGNVARFINAPPFGIGVGVQGNYPTAPQGRIVVEPLSGKLLLFSAGPNLLYELDPTNVDATWTRLTDPPSGIPSLWGGSAPGAYSLSSISDYGVVMLIVQPAATGGSVWLYRR